MRKLYDTTRVQLHMNYEKTTVVLQMVTTVFDTILLTVFKLNGMDKAVFTTSTTKGRILSR